MRPSLAVAESTVYFCTEDDLIHAVDAKTGGELWSLDLGYGVWTAPVAKNDLLLVSLGDYLVALGGRTARLEQGAKARVTTDTKLLAAPNPTGVERSTLSAGTVVTLTGESETRSDIEWWPVTVDETGATGWVDGSVLEPMGLA
jgi:outer membrane protein assembly factor BamB